MDGLARIGIGGMALAGGYGGIALARSAHEMEETRPHGGAYSRHHGINTSIGLGATVAAVLLLTTQRVPGPVAAGAAALALSYMATNLGTETYLRGR